MDNHKSDNIMEQEKKTSDGVSKRAGISIMLALALIAGAVIGYTYWQAVRNQVYVDKSEISAPAIDLSSVGGGELKGLFVKVGDSIPAGFVVAQVNNEMVRTATPGLVINVENSLGQNFPPGQPIVTIINPQDLRVVAQVEENKGLDRIKAGQLVVFTVDAFGSRKFYGTVDEVAATSEDSSVVFSISDQRQVKIFDVKIRYDEQKYPELKNGMSAKSWIEAE